MGPGARAGSACVERLFALEGVVRPEWIDPDPAPPTPLSRDAFARALAEIDAAPDRFFVAKAAGAYVGYSSLVALGTAVHPELRRRGIGTALKGLVLQDARARGLGRIVTCTAHPAMRAINEKLGYRVFRTEVRLLRVLQGSCSGPTDRRGQPS